MTELDPRRVEYLPVAELSANPRNPKAHSGEVIDDSIGRFGMLDPIVRDERTGYIISGHGRRQALADREARGETPPEGVKVADDGSWLVPVVVGWASRSDTEASAALIALNRTTELGGWVDEELLGLLNDLSEAGGDEAFVGVGFTDADREALEYLTREEPPSLDDLAEQHPPREGDFTGSISAGGGPITCPNCGHDIEQ
ncbi:MAG TPA: hypothetical protein VK039_08360 [Brevibacterium sp.]|nr:hypothetical protein [Brevibacterium sp.]